MWLFLSPNRWSRWTEWIPNSRARLRQIVPSLRFYLFLDREAPPVAGHNPLAGLTYTVVYVMLAVAILTGIALWGVEGTGWAAWLTGWLRDLFSLRRRALHRWAANPHIEVLGNRRAPRLSIVSLRLRHGAKYLHHNFVVALLNDLFGIQARGGCSCAGPYGHRLLAIDPAHSHAFRDEIGHGCEGIKPGWVRLNFNYFISDTVADYLIDAVDLIATNGHRLLTDYRFNPHTGLWRHHHVAAEAPLLLADLYSTAGGTLTGPARRPAAGEEVLGGYLHHAAQIISGHPDDIDDGPPGLPPDFEALRWFHLPPICLTHTEATAPA